MARKKVNKKCVVKSEKELAKYGLDESLRSCKEAYYFCEPTRTFEIGEEVIYGTWCWSAVLEKFENGKYYKIITLHESRNRNTDPYLKIHYKQWYAIEKIYNGTPNSLIKNEDIRFNFYTSRINSLIKDFENFGVDLNPIYQRGLVWGKEQEIALINSIFTNIEIGKFAFIRRSFSHKGELFEILDGKQRLNTLLKFYYDRFKYNGYFYSELNNKDKNHFLNFSISKAETEPITEKQKINYFLYLNTNGIQVSKEHIEKIKLMGEKL